MDFNFGGTQCESCGKSFVDPGRLFTHQKKLCKSTKRGLREVLGDAKAYWERRTRKRPRIAAPPPGTGVNNDEPVQMISSGPSDQETREAGSTAAQNERLKSNPDGSEGVAGHLSDLVVLGPTPGDFMHGPATTNIPPIEDLPHRRPARERRLPARYRVSLSPEPPPHVPAQVASEIPESTSGPDPTVLSWLERARTFKTSTNRFGIFRQFFGLGFPSHDPDAITSAQELCDGHLIEERSASDKEGPPPPRHGLSGSEIEPSNLFYPYSNESSFKLAEWWNQGVLNSLERFKQLIEIVGSPDFKSSDIADTNWTKAHQLLPYGKILGVDLEPDPNEGEWVDDIGCDWMTTEIVIDVPFPTHGHGPNTVRFNSGTLHHRSIVSVIHERFSDPEGSLHHHYRPYSLMWEPKPESPPIRIHGELYTSDEFFRIEKEVQQLSLNVDDHHLERVVVAMMFWTDATLLANFGTAKLWPCYLFFGNDSKYRRARTSLELCNHLAYFEMLPPTFKDWYHAQKGHSPPKDIYSHCNREIFHRQWDILLDESLLKAMREGIRIQCPDGVMRLFFPRVFTYSADYPEKALVATIRSNGLLPCPRCLIAKRDLGNTGTREDKEFRTANSRVDATRQALVESARQLIHGTGLSVTSTKVEGKLFSQSLVPVTNAFSKLGEFGFDVFPSLVVDLLHEFELGVWKSLFIHLIRILEAEDRLSTGRSSKVDELDRRYRNMPGFALGTVRKFSSNASEQKRLGARDYENLLQCSIPAFEGLLPPPHNDSVLNLLSLCCEWHALAKLRMHTDETIDLLSKKTDLAAVHFRRFIETTCSEYDTRETDKEEAARIRKITRQKKKKEVSPQEPIAAATVDSLAAQNSITRPMPDVGTGTTGPEVVVQQVEPRLPDGGGPAPQEPGIARTPEASTVTTSRSDHTQTKLGDATGSRSKKLAKKLNICTYKFHAMADYPESIRRYGTTDSSSTERGETEHRLPKSWYLRTDKKTYRSQLAKMERRRANIKKIRRRAAMCTDGSSKPTPKAATVDQSTHYVIGVSQNNHESITEYRQSPANRGDPSLYNFIPNLQRHLLPRIEEVLKHRDEDFLDHVPNHTLDDSNFSCIVFSGQRIYTHKTMRIRFTTYDVRRDEDTIRAKTPKGNIMVLDPGYIHGASDHHPYRYAHVLGIYHANVIYVGPGNSDFSPARLDFLWVRWFQWNGTRDGLPNLSYPPVSDPQAFSFIDPNEVVRACHIMPRFSPGLRHENAMSLSRHAQDGFDHLEYSVGIYADRDMYMRYQWGLGVGHQYTHPSRLDFMSVEDGLINSVPSEDRISHPAISTQGPSTGLVQGPDQETVRDVGELGFEEAVGDLGETFLGEHDMVYRDEDESGDEDGHLQDEATDDSNSDDDDGLK